MLPPWTQIPPRRALPTPQQQTATTMRRPTQLMTEEKNEGSNDAPTNRYPALIEVGANNAPVDEMDKVGSTKKEDGIIDVDETHNDILPPPPRTWAERFHLNTIMENTIKMDSDDVTKKLTLTLNQGILAIIQAHKDFTILTITSGKKKADNTPHYLK